MWRNCIRKFVVLIFCGALIGPAFSQDKPRNKLPNISEFFPDFLEKLAADSHYIGENYTHEEWEVNDDIKDGVIKRKDEKTYFVQEQDGVLFRKLISKDGESVTNSKFELKREWFRFDANFFHRYTLTVNGEEVLGGEKCWVVSLRPQANFPEIEKTDRILNNLSGEIWIEESTLLFKQLKVYLTKEVQYAWPGIAGGKAKKAECIIKAGIIDGHFTISYFWVDYQYSARVIGFPINGHKIKTVNYQKYERRTK